MERFEPASNVSKGESRPFITDPREVLGQINLLNAVRIELQSAVFADERPIPQKYTGEGDDVSPPLRWYAVPEISQSLLLFCEDPDAPSAEPFVHWVLYNLPPDLRELGEAVPKVRNPPSLRGAIQCDNDGGSVGYMGPMPPRGHGVHHYHFQLFALNTTIELPNKVRGRDLVTAITNHVIGAGKLVGTYERQ